MVFKPKIPIWVNFGGSCNGSCWYILLSFGVCILRPFGIFCGHLVYFWSFGVFLVIWCIFGHLIYFSSSGILYQANSDHPGSALKTKLCSGIYLSYLI
jgi:hypothetical protein